MNYLFLFLFIISFAACSYQEVDPEIMSKAYVDLLVAKETFPKGSDTLAAVSNEVFLKYNISSDQYYAALKSYKADQKKWDEFFDKSRKYLDSLIAKDKFK